MGASPGEITRLLNEVRNGDRAAEAKLLPLVYQDLRRRAANYMRGERIDHTLKATALVHEAYIKLIDQRRFRGRTDSLRSASQSCTLTHAIGSLRLIWPFPKGRFDKARVSLQRYYASPTTKVLGIFGRKVAPCFPAEDTRPKNEPCTIPRWVVGNTEPDNDVT